MPILNYGIIRQSELAFGWNRGLSLCYGTSKTQEIKRGRSRGMVKGHPDLTVIGHMADKAVGYQLITRGGQQIGIKAQGWDALLHL